MWIVKVVKKPVPWLYHPDYFPRILRYKRQALELEQEVENMGGKVEISKHSRLDSPKKLTEPS